MILFPAIDLYQGKAVRLFQGDYNRMTVYCENPPELVRKFAKKGATHLHLVDLEGARTGKPENIKTVERILNAAGLFTEIGGGIRTMEAIETYRQVGVDRVILGTSAVTDPDFLKEALNRYGAQIAVGVDLRDGYVAIKGWTERSTMTGDEFLEQMESLGVATVICTDISRDGAMQGTNLAMYQKFSQNYSGRMIASGGVSSLEDIRQLRECHLHGAIIGKAYYTGAVNLEEAIKEAR